MISVDEMVVGVGIVHKAGSVTWLGYKVMSAFALSVAVITSEEALLMLVDAGA